MTSSLGAPAATGAGTPSDGRLPRRLGGWSTAAVTVGIMIGSGIFRVPAAAAAAAGTPEAMLLTWVVGGLVAMCGALALAEVAALFPNAGGMYVYLREAYGPLTGFLYGWLYLFVIPAGAGAIALVFAEYLGRLVPLAPGQIRGVAILAHHPSGRRAVPLGPLRGGDSERLHHRQGARDPRADGRRVPARQRQAAGRGPPARLPRRRAGAASASASSRCSGRTTAGRTSPVSRAKCAIRPRALPRAIVGGTLAVVVIYLLANAAYLRVLSIEEMARSPLVAADVAVRLVDPPGRR